MSGLLGDHVSGAITAPLFDVRSEPVHGPAQRCKLYRRCFGLLALTPSVNEILSEFIITFRIYIPNQKTFLPFRMLTSASRGMLQTAGVKVAIFTS